MFMWEDDCVVCQMHASVYVSWQLPDYSIFGFFVCFSVVICVFSSI